MSSILMAEDYQRHKRLMYAVLAHLARTGFRVPPADTLDLIHDFFAEEWQGLRERLDESRGDFSALLYTSFMRFARRRIVRDTRLRSMLSELDDGEIGSVGKGEVDDSIDLEAVSRAIEQLPAKTRKILAVYCGVPSAREAARRLGMSRHKLREAVLEGLSSLAVVMNLRSGLSETQWRFASMLWSEQRSLDDIRATLNLSTTQAIRIYRQVIDAIAKSIRLQFERSRDDDRGSLYSVEDSATAHKVGGKE